MIQDSTYSKYRFPVHASRRRKDKGIPNCYRNLKFFETKKKELVFPSLNIRASSSYNKNRRNQNQSTTESYALPNIHRKNSSIFSPLTVKRKEEVKKSKRILKCINNSAPSNYLTTNAIDPGLLKSGFLNGKGVCLPRIHPMNIKRFSTQGSNQPARTSVNYSFSKLTFPKHKTRVQKKKESKKDRGTANGNKFLYSAFNRSAKNDTSTNYDLLPACDVWLDYQNEFKASKMFFHRQQLFQDIEIYLNSPVAPGVKEDMNEKKKVIENHIRKLLLLENEYKVLKKTKKTILRKIRKVNRYGKLVKKNFTSLLRKKCSVGYNCTFVSESLPELELLGDDCMLEIMMFLTPKDLFVVGCVCQRFYFYGTSNIVWRKLIVPKVYRKSLMELYESKTSGESQFLFWKIWYFKLENCRVVLGKNIRGLWSICDVFHVGAVDLSGFQIGLSKCGFDWTKNEIMELFKPFINLGSISSKSYKGKSKNKKRRKKFITYDILKQVLLGEKGLKVLVIKNI